MAGPSPRAIRVALAQYPIGCFASAGAWRDKLARWVGEAAAGGAQLLVFPEYGQAELASLLPPDVRGDLKGHLEPLQALVPEALALHADLAARHKLHLLMGSLPVRAPGQPGRFVNRAHLFGPDGGHAAQDKLMMTRFEAEQWGIAPGDGLSVFDTALGRIGVAICYDAEFPLIPRRLAEAGARLILVPSCTDAAHGYHRVRVACQARALESQCLVVQAPTVGAADWSPAVDVNVGAAGAFGPPDRGFPADGVLALGTMDAPGWVFADLDLAAVDRVRLDGAVLNHRDWDRQGQAAEAAPRALTTIVKAV
ncbi:MAG: carbon-nitrogen hydrolase family protein [Alphaproteobacteria bacterium]|nr:carbon-nitrogen hydrolase family protein [Alphaproteobacteria bacterium]